jgi:cytochrome c peroxidase
MHGRGTMTRLQTSGKMLPILLLILSILFFVQTAFAAGGDADTLKQAGQAFGHLPKVFVSDKNPVTPAKLELGRILFFENRVSVDGTASCIRCHPFSLYAADGLRKSIGHDCKVNPRNAPTILNVAGQISIHWIGNREDVEDQAKQALLGPPSFGMPSYQAVEAKLKEIKGYAPLFQKAFPGEKDPITADNFAKAVGAFERTLIIPSRFDAYLAGGKTALKEPEKKGLKLFMDKGCAGCHSGPLIGGESYKKFGLSEPYWEQTKSKEIDEGRFTVTKDEKDKYFFKVPPLRNVQMTSPYFHDGSVDRLQDAVLIMGKVQLGMTLTDAQTGEIVVFLKSLTGQIPAKVLQAPILPPSE